MHCRFVESPAADEAECRRYAQHGQHAKQETERADRVKRGQSGVPAVQRARGLRPAEASEKQGLGQRMRGRGNQRAVVSEGAGRGQSEQQKADILDRGQDQEALEATLREHQKRSEER